MNRTLVKVFKLNFPSLSAFRAYGSQKGEDKVSRSICDAGYRAELHKIETSDGYILNTHRVLPVSREPDRGPILLMHGIFRSSADFVLTGPKIALAYLLSDHGFDVWIGNARGNKFSEEHRELNYKSKEFWKFSFHEIGCCDLPAVINYMLNESKQTKASYIGHSQGAVAILTLLSMMPEFNEKLHQVHLMSPAAFLTYSSNYLINLYAPHLRKISALADTFSRVNISSLLKLGTKFAKINVKDKKSAIYIYKKITCPLVGHNKDELEIDPNILPTFFEDMSPIVSANQLIHFLQLHLSERFQQFDYGLEKNMALYHQAAPPEYELKNVTSPTYIYHAIEDLMVAKNDVDHLTSLLPNVQLYRTIENWNHLDFITGKNSRKVLYDDIVQSLKSS